MKRVALAFCVALLCTVIGRAAYRAASPPQPPLSKFVPAGPLLYLEAKDFSSLLGEWNSSRQKKDWVDSDSYQVFSRSRLFLRLKGAGDQFAATAGLPPNIDFLSEVAGQHSVIAIYDIGKLQFLYITYLPSAQSMRTDLWQTRAKFEKRNSAGFDFYLRRDPESEREVAFAISGDYLLLATRENLIAEALQLIFGKQDRTVESDSWWAQSTSATGQAGDLRMVMDLQSLVPNGYFRTYWVQQNITDLSQYSSAVSDLFRSGKQYRDERVLIRKKAPEPNLTSDGMSAAADLSRFIPENAGLYVTRADPSADASFHLLETKVLSPHPENSARSQFAPQVQLTSGEQGSSSDLEERIDQKPSESPLAAESASELRAMIDKMPITASLLVQSTQADPRGVFVRIHSVVVLMGASDWNESEASSAITEYAGPSMTASKLGLQWQQQRNYRQLDGLWPLFMSVRGKYLVVSDDSDLMEASLARSAQNSDRKPLRMLAGFNHSRERENFARLSGSLDLRGAAASGERQPQFFSGTMASLSKILASVSAEQIEIRNDGDRERQTVTYEWSK